MTNRYVIRALESLTVNGPEKFLKNLPVASRQELVKQIDAKLYRLGRKYVELTHLDEPPKLIMNLIALTYADLQQNRLCLTGRKYHPALHRPARS